VQARRRLFHCGFASIPKPHMQALDLIMRIASESYETKYQDYIAAIAWMESLGLDVNRGRLSHYRQIIGYWKDAYKIATIEEAQKAFPDFVNAMREIEDFISVFRAFGSEPKSNLSLIRDKIEKSIGGPADLIKENSKSNVSRNFLFEAVTAAKAHQPGRGVAAILNADSDTGIAIDNKKIWVECKRLSSAKKIEANVKDASNQLEKIIRKQTGSGHKGIVALDVSKLFNPGDKIYPQTNDLELVSSINQMMDKFIEENSKYWEKIYSRRSRSIIGTIIRFSFMSVSEVRNLLVTTSQWGLNPRQGVSDADERVLMNLVTKLGDES
jgi:hypothetical protein